MFHKPSPNPWDVRTYKGTLEGNIYSGFDHEIDVLEEVTARVRDRGHYIAFRKITSNICPNFNLDRREDHPDDCPYCMGTGYIFEDYIIKSYSRPTRDIEAQAKSVRIEIGVMSPNRWTYYFPAYIQKNKRIYLNPTHKDYIIELELNHENNLPAKPYRFKKILKIEVVAELRDKGGRLEYYNVNTREMTTGR